MLKRKKKENVCPPRKKKGQSTLEYVILVAAVIAAVLAFVPTFRTAYNTTLAAGTNMMTNMAGRLRDSYADAP